MPEGLEAELYRRVAERCVGRTIDTVVVDDRQEMAGELARVLPGLTLAATRRIGKLVLVDTTAPAGADTGAGSATGPTLGLHFGMTGRLVVDDRAAIEQLQYASGRDAPEWDRLVVTFDDGGALRVNDPRRWARFTLEPDETRLGPDVLATRPGPLRDHLSTVIARRRAAVKSVLLDQSVVAGLGNLCVDEVLWQAGISPLRPAGELSPDEVAELVGAIGEHLPAMLARGGSHRGVIDPEVRSTLPPCPRDGSTLRRDTVGGRTTVWCARHQH